MKYTREVFRQKNSNDKCQQKLQEIMSNQGKKDKYVSKSKFNITIEINTNNIL
jgi:hypothetical protein